jgi:hypothetical protein
MKRSLLWIIPVLAALLIGCVAIGALRHGGDTSVTVTPTHPVTVTAVPAALDHHFSFGVMSNPGEASYLDGMRSHNGTTWDLRYQYLAGGVNTGTGWQTWNAGGAYAANYMEESDNHGYMPALVYYMLLQSNGANGSSEPNRDLAHLADASVMRAYYADWTKLMRDVGAFKKPAVVIVEPDLWGFVEQKAAAYGNSAAGVPASVASSGNPALASYPNTAQGFAWALLHLRDLYAPNAILALHVSPWGSQLDIATSKSQYLNPTLAAQQQAYFLSTAGLEGNPTGVSSWDILSGDIADHDSGQAGAWWDATNATFPNFARYLSYVHALVKNTGRRLLMWQAPIGNQYFDTENNTQGHTQDNKAQYILDHVADFASAGVIGVLFGPGNGGTYAQDARHDGVTNPAPISTYQCDKCNSHKSSYADDDGGYLRIFVGQYYKSGAYSLPQTLA